jgi:serine/threonine-protein kinase
LCAPVDLRRALRRLEPSGRGAWLQLGSRRLALVAAPDAPGAGQRYTLSLPGASVELWVTAPPAKLPAAAIAACLAGALASLGLALRPRRPTPGLPSPSRAATDLQSTPPAPSPPVAERRLGRYALTRLIGSGAIADVYVARSLGEAQFERRVALKLLHRASAQSQRVLARFVDEARLAAGLNHPNIVHIFDLGRVGEQYFIAMELIDGADLDRLMSLARARRCPIPAGVALRILSRICAGLHAAHTAAGPDGAPLELVHRDVKGVNVLVARNGAVKIGDFGAAQARHDLRARTTGASELRGTLAYMAPEQRLGRAVDRRADEYGVGALAYELLSCKRVDLDVARMSRLGRDGWPHLPPLAQLRPDLPRELDAIINRALAYDADSRYPDLAALQDVLETVAGAHDLRESDRAVGRWVEETLAWGSHLAEPDVPSREPSA